MGGEGPLDGVESGEAVPPPGDVCWVDWLGGGEPRGARVGAVGAQAVGDMARRPDGARGTRGGRANAYTSLEDFL